MRNIFLLVFILFASLSYSFKSENHSFETSSEIEFNQQAIAIGDALVLINNTEIISFDKILILESRSERSYEVLIVLKYPNLESNFSHSFARPLFGYHSNLKELSVYLAIDKYVTMG